MTRQFEFVSADDGQTYYLELEHDEFAESPRQWDSFGTMLCWHGRYDLGDENPYSDPMDFWEEWGLQGIEDNEPDDLKWLPLSLYDHSGITMKVGVLSGWDTGVVGFIYATREDANKWGIAWDDVHNQLALEVEAYDDYLVNGAQYAAIYTLDPNYSIEDVYGEYKYQAVMEQVDSCGGFYGLNTVNDCEDATEILNCMGWGVSSIRCLREY